MLQDFIKKAEYWFHNIGPFVYPEDDETWESFKEFMMTPQSPKNEEEKL